jgi:hypothetical protein
MTLEETERDSAPKSAVRPYMLCGPSDGLSTTMKAVDDAHLVFLKKSLNAACLLTPSSDAKIIGTEAMQSSSYQYHSYPRSLKVHQSVLAFIMAFGNAESTSIRDSDYLLAVEFFPFKSYQYSDFPGPSGYVLYSTITHFLSI